MRKRALMGCMSHRAGGKKVTFYTDDESLVSKGLMLKLDSDVM